MTPEELQTCREAFEKWAQDHRPDIDVQSLHDNAHEPRILNPYSDFETNWFFQGYQAAYFARPTQVPPVTADVLAFKEAERLVDRGHPFAAFEVLKAAKVSRFPDPVKYSDGSQSREFSEQSNTETRRMLIDGAWWNCVREPSRPAKDSAHVE